MRLQCKIFETLAIDEKSHTDKESSRIKNCVGVIYVTNAIWIMLILSPVSADFGISQV